MLRLRRRINQHLAVRRRRFGQVAGELVWTVGSVDFLVRQAKLARSCR
jgi:hypothetical protein